MSGALLFIADPFHQVPYWKISATQLRKALAVPPLQPWSSCALRHCQQLQEEPGHCCSILPILVPNSIPVTLLEEGMLGSSLFWLLLSKSESVSYLLLAIHFIPLKICTKPWLWGLSNPLKCFLLENQACISSDPPLLHPPKLKLYFPKTATLLKHHTFHTVVINKVWTMFPETLKNQVKNSVWIPVLLNKPIIQLWVINVLGFYLKASFSAHS